MSVEQINSAEKFPKFVTKDGYFISSIGDQIYLKKKDSDEQSTLSYDDIGLNRKSVHSFDEVEKAFASAYGEVEEYAK